MLFFYFLGDFQTKNTASQIAGSDKLYWYFVSLEFELIANGEHEYAVLRSLVAVLLEHLGNTEVIASINNEALVLIRKAHWN